MPEPNISTCQDFGMWQISVCWWWICCTTSCRIVASFSVSVVQHVCSRCPCSGVWRLLNIQCNRAAAWNSLLTLTMMLTFQIPCFTMLLLPLPLLSEWRRYCVTLCVCVRRISLGGEGNALYPVLSSYVLCCSCVFSVKVTMILIRISNDG